MLWQRLDELYEVGVGASAATQGARRPAYTPAEDEAHRLVAGWMRDAGLGVSVDPAGNLFGRLAGADPAAGEVWSGSHLDSVPGGGRFDGPLGVLGALEAVARIGPQRCGLTVVAFRDEEGWRFGRGCFGSRAMAGRLECGELETTDADGVTLRDAIGRELPSPGWLEAPRAYLELHIEQGAVLDGLDLPLGVVTSIAGLARLGVSFAGRAGHAGTTPMDGRSDALCAAAAFVLDVRRAAVEIGQGVVATVGALEVHPGAANVIPERVDLVVDARAPSKDGHAALLARIRSAAGLPAPQTLRLAAPVPMSKLVRDACGSEIESRGLPVHELPSGAGHDAGVMGVAGVPAGMLFVRSRNGGLSHHPEEWSEPHDVELAVDVLAGALRRLAG
ncbi:MAG: Zn-dependent hydrolase [Gaiella sp.]